MRRLLFHFSALFLSTLSLDSEFNEPTYKFGILAGEPTSLNGSSAVQVSSFDECVEKCSEDFECILASQNASTAPCNLFKWNTVTGVRRNESGGEGFVAFRLFTDQPACELNLPLLLNGKTYQLYPNDTDQYLWKVDTTEDGFNITYIRTREDQNLICGNWSYNRPYADGCNQECLLSMVQVYAEPGPMSNYFKNFDDPEHARRFNTSTTWDDCMNQCYGEIRCVLAFFREDTKNCTWYAPEDETYLIKRTSAADGWRAAFKVKLNNETCKYTTEQLLNGTYFMTNITEVFSGFDARGYGIQLTDHYTPFWRIQTTDEYYLLKFFDNETMVWSSMQPRAVPGCGLELQPSADTKGTNHSFCYRPFQYTGLSQPLAKKYCNLIEGVLLPELHSEMWDHIEGGDLVTFDILFGGGLGKWGFRLGSMLVPGEIKVWAGIEKDPECMNTTNIYCQGNQQWVFSDPSLPVYLFDYKYKTYTFAKNITWSWADGQPEISPTKNCVYFLLTKITYGQDFKLYTSECDATDIDGFYCAIEGQQRLGVPKFADMVAAFGVGPIPIKYDN